VRDVASLVRVGNGRTRVLVIGGGFGGLFCARRLGGADVDVTLLDRAAGHVFQPLLYQCATGTLSVGQISRSLREELAGHRNVTTLLGDAVDLDPAARRVTARRPPARTPSTTTCSWWPRACGSPTSVTRSTRGGRRG
jgi:NADH dehydrogenase